MRNDYSNVYVICEQADGRFRLECGGQDLHLGPFPTAQLAERKVDELIRESGGEKADWGFKRPWTATCPNCKTKNSLIVVRTGGEVLHQCAEPDSRCTYERKV